MEIEYSWKGFDSAGILCRGTVTASDLGAAIRLLEERGVRYTAFRKLGIAAESNPAGPKMTQSTFIPNQDTAATTCKKWRVVAALFLMTGLGLFVLVGCLASERTRVPPDGVIAAVAFVASLAASAPAWFQTCPECESILSRRQMVVPLLFRRMCPSCGVSLW